MNQKFAPVDKKDKMHMQRQATKARASDDKRIAQQLFAQLQHEDETVKISKKLTGKKHKFVRFAVHDRISNWFL